MAVLPLAGGDLYTDQAQAAPKNQAGAVKATFSENKLLTTLDGIGSNSFSCQQTDLVGWYHSQGIKWKYGGKDNPKYHSTEEQLCTLTFLAACLKDSFTQPESKSSTIQPVSQHEYMKQARGGKRLNNLKS